MNTQKDDPKRYKLEHIDSWMTSFHPATECEGRPCPIHNKTDHHMRSWPQWWRNDRGIMERLCSHGIGHPDPDQFEYWKRTEQEYESVHGCDGCCIRSTDAAVESDDDQHQT